MILVEFAAIVYCLVTAIVALFQIALSLGAPWGEYSMGGKYRGKYPPRMRGVAVVNAALLLATGLVVLSRAGLLLPRWTDTAPWLIWVVVAFSAMSFVMNMMTPSRGERIRWAPAALVMLVSSILVAVSEEAPLAPS